MKRAANRDSTERSFMLLMLMTLTRGRDEKVCGFSLLGLGPIFKIWLPKVSSKDFLGERERVNPHWRNFVIRQIHRHNFHSSASLKLASPKSELNE